LPLPLSRGKKRWRGRVVSSPVTGGESSILCFPLTSLKNKRGAQTEVSLSSIRRRNKTRGIYSFARRDYPEEICLEEFPNLQKKHKN
jgi:hypothetical protein